MDEELELRIGAGDEGIGQGRARKILRLDEWKAGDQVSTMKHGGGCKIVDIVVRGRRRGDVTVRDHIRRWFGYVCV